MNDCKPDAEHSPEARAQAFERRARDLLDASTGDLDARSLSRLAQARRAALAELAGGRRGIPAWLVPAGGVAAAALAVLVWRVPGGGPAVVMTADAPVALASPLEDLEIVVGAESLDLLEELEFYAWLDEATGFVADEGGAG